MARRARPAAAAAVAVAALVLALALSPAAPAAAGASAPRCEDQQLVPAPANVERVAAATRCLINAERARSGRAPLRSSGQLARAARRHSLRMVGERFFSHVTPAGSTVLDRLRRETGYLRRARSYALAENIAWGMGALATPLQTVRSWMRSSGHRRNMLDPAYRDVGVGVAPGAPQGASGAAATYTAVFARRSGGRR